MDDKAAKLTSEYKGKKYFFCDPGCKKKYDTDPTKYAWYMATPQQRFSRRRLFLGHFLLRLFSKRIHPEE
jgi:YHS domain-containing protein